MQFLRLIAQLSAVRATGKADRRPAASGRLLRLEPLESRQLLAAAGFVPVGAQPEGGLSGKIVYTRAGHGWNYYSSLGRWSTDRGNVQSIVEDFGNQDQVTMYADYLLRAGATVVPLRPVGRQINEVVLDNDSPGVTFTGAWANNTSGARWYDEDYGASVDAVKYRTASANGTEETAIATYTPNIPQGGLYPVYAWVAHGSDRTDQLYKINHTGGQTQITVDHRMVGNGWVYLGSYHFNSGSSAAEGSVQISNYSIGGGRSSLVVADAIRFGNGMGDLRWGSSGIGTGNVSGYPREDEGTLAWVYRGFGQGVTPSSVLGTSDVTASTRMAAHMTPSSNPFGSSLLISFHSNAGGGRGTEGLVHSSNPTPNQQSLATMFAQQIEIDMIARNGQFPYNWSTRRDYATGAYGEINNTWIGGKFDATIIEVGFHDSTMDSAFMRDPRGRDQMARSSYEATLEYFINFGNVKPANVTLPSAPINFGVVSNASGEVTLSWNAGLSSSGVGGVYGNPATGYRIYASTDGRGFDGGTYVAGGATTSVTLSGYDPSIPYYFKIVAENAGGQSLGSEVLTVLPRGGQKQVLIVNGFDRYDESQNFSYPYAYNGGAPTARVWSRYNNSFDYVIQVQAAIHASRPGVNVAGTSNERIVNGSVNLSDYDAVIWILGTESTSTSTFSSVEQTRVEQFIAAGGHLFVTGSEIGWDLDASNNGRSFYENTLKGDYIADGAGTYNVTAAAGGIFAGLPLFQFSNGAAFSSLDSQMYNVQFADVISPQSGGQLALRYSGGSNGGAGIQVPGADGRGNVVMFGFPFETITVASTRAAVMDRVLGYFGVSAVVPLNADFDSNGIVDGADFLAWQRNFGAAVPPVTNGDANGDGAVDIDDLTIWRDQFGGPPPEPIAAAATVASLQAEEPLLATQPVAETRANMPDTQNAYSPLAQHAANVDSAAAKAMKDDRQSRSRLVNEGFPKFRGAPAVDLAVKGLSRRNLQSLNLTGVAVEQDAPRSFDDASIDDALAAEWTWLRQF